MKAGDIFCTVGLSRARCEDRDFQAAFSVQHVMTQRKVQDCCGEYDEDQDFQAASSVQHVMMMLRKVQNCCTGYYQDQDFWATFQFWQAGHTHNQITQHCVSALKHTLMSNLDRMDNQDSQPNDHDIHPCFWNPVHRSQCICLVVL